MFSLELTGAVGAFLQVQSLQVIPPLVLRRIVNMFLYENIPIMWITDSGYGNLTQQISAAEQSGARLNVTISEPQNATIST